MRAIAKIDRKQIEEMHLDITFRMTVKEWYELIRALPNQTHVPNSVGRHISTVLGHITKSTEMTFCDPLHEKDND